MGGGQAVGTAWRRHSGGGCAAWRGPRETLARMNRNRIVRMVALRRWLDAELAREAARAGSQLPGAQARRGVSFVVLPAPTLAAAAADIVRLTTTRGAA